MKLPSLLFASLLLLAPFSTHATDAAHIQVQAAGTIDVLPDYIQVEVSIDKMRKSRSEAKAETDRIAQQVLDVAKKMNIESNHIQASDIFIQPEYEWRNNKRITIGERVHRTVLIKLYQLDNYSNLAEKLAQLDISNLQQLGFGFDNIDEHQNQALMQALDKARLKAQKIADKIQRKLGSVQMVSESGDYFPVMHPQMERMVAMAADSAEEAAPLEIKPQTVTATVNVIYLLE